MLHKFYQLFAKLPHTCLSLSLSLAISLSRCLSLSLLAGTQIQLVDLKCRHFCSSRRNVLKLTNRIHTPFKGWGKGCPIHCLNINNDASCLGVSTLCVFVCLLPPSIESYRYLLSLSSCRDRVALRVVCHKLSSNLIGVPPLTPPASSTLSVCPNQRKARKNYAKLSIFFFFFFSCFLHFPVSTKRAFLCLAAHSICHAHFHYFYHFQFQLVDQLLCEPLK